MITKEADPVLVSVTQTIIRFVIHPGREMQVVALDRETTPTIQAVTQALVETALATINITMTTILVKPVGASNNEVMMVET